MRCFAVALPLFLVFLSQVADLHSGESAAAEFINGQTR
jgi:hypothetical protein